MALQTKTFEGTAGTEYWRYTVEVTENSTDTSANTSSVTAKVYLGRTGSGSSMTGASISGTVTIDGTPKSFSYSNAGTVSVGVGQKILLIGTMNWTISHSSDGSKTVSITSSMTNNVRPVSGTLTSKSMALTDIDRIPTVSQSNTAKTETTITMKWTSDLTIDRVRYSTNGGSTWTTYTSSANAKTGTYTISGLTAGTTYSIKTEVRSKDSGQAKASSALSVKTNALPTVTQSVSSKTETSITLKWTSDSTIDRVRYSLDAGENWTTVTAAANAKTGTFTIGSLTANSSYTIRTEVRRDGTSVTNYSNLSVTTYNYPYANSMPDFVIGSTLRIGIYNPLGRTVKVYLRAGGSTIGNVNTTTGTSVSGYTSSVYTDDLYDSIPNDLSGQYAVRCVTTINGVDHTLNKTGGIYSVNTNANKPSIGAVTYEDTNADTYAITEERTAIISGQSDVKVYASGLSAQNGATVASCTFVYSGSSVNRPMTVSGSTAEADNTYKFSGNSVKVTVTVTDSRGLTDIRSVTISLIPYVNPTAKISLYRENSYYDTTYLTVTAGCSPVTVNGVDKNSIVKVAYATRLAGTEDPFLPNPPTEIASGTQYTLSFANSSAWDFKIWVYDDLKPVSFTAQLPKGIPLVMFDRKRNSVGINAIPTQDDVLEMDGTVRLKRTGSNPVIYMEDENTNLSSSGFLTDMASRRVEFREYRAHASIDGVTRYDGFRLPAPTIGDTSANATYEILTSKGGWSEATIATELNKFLRFTMTAGQTKQLTLSANGRFIVVGIGAGNCRAIFLVNTTSTGTVTASTVYNAGTQISINTGTAYRLGITTSSYGTSWLVYMIGGTASE